jgi:hypothetical protein
MRREDMNDEDNMDDCMLGDYRMCDGGNDGAGPASANATPGPAGTKRRE